MHSITNWLRHPLLALNSLAEYCYYKYWQVLAFLFFGLPVAGKYLSQKWFWTGGGTVVLVYHELSAPSFEAHLRYITEHWRVISLDDLVGHIKRRENLSNVIVITFDDGYKSNYTDIFPIIKKYHIPVTIYLVSDVVTAQSEFWWQLLNNLRIIGGKEETIPSVNYYKSISEEQRRKEIDELKVRHSYIDQNTKALSVDEIKKMSGSGLISVGSHTKGHPCLTKTIQEDAMREIANSKSDLESTLGIKVKHFAYPNGDYSHFHVSACAQSGYLTAATANPGANTPATNPYELRRIAIRPEDTTNQLAMKITSLGHKLGIDYLAIRHLRERGVPC